MIATERIEKGAIFFLTNNANTEELLKWLLKREPCVYRCEEKLTVAMMEEYEPSFIISFNYRYILPEEVLSMLPDRAINLHMSLLPYNRGSFPNFFSFYENTPKGVTIHKLEKGLDTGEILCQKRIEFDEEKETFASSYDTLLREMESCFKEHWDEICGGEGRLSSQKQQGDIGSYHTKRDLEEIRKKYPFSWQDNIADWKRRMGIPLQCEI